jgi:hypothetical protein
MPRRGTSLQFRVFLAQFDTDGTCSAGSNKLNHKDREDLKEPAIHPAHAPSIAPQGRSAARCNIFVRVARESAIQEVPFRVPVGLAFPRNPDKDVGHRPPLRKGKLSVTPGDKFKRIFFEVFVVFVVPFSS